tara:strand:- start:465 stop:866 length:402 start_codon:yes stop_codon:yes gene_type:complete
MKIKTTILDGNLTLTTTEDSTRLDKLKVFTREQLMSAVSLKVVELEEHFSGDYTPWDLSGNVIVDDILYDLMGDHLSEAIYGVLNEAFGTDTEYSGKGAYIILPRTYVYYDNKKDKFSTSKKINTKLELMGLL